MAPVPQPVALTRGGTVIGDAIIELLFRADAEGEGVHDVSGPPVLSDQELAQRVRKEIREWRRAVRLQHERMLSHAEGSNWAIDFKFYLVALRIIEDVASEAQNHIDRQNEIANAVKKFTDAIPAYKQMRDVLVVHIGSYIVGQGRLQQKGIMVDDPWGSYDRSYKGGTVYSHAGELVLPEATQAAEELCDAVLRVVDAISPEP